MNVSNKGWNNLINNGILDNDDFTGSKASVATSKSTTAVTPTAAISSSSSNTGVTIFPGIA